MTRTFDPIWEEKYSAGHCERYPWDCVVSFYFRNRGSFGGRPRVLEVGCGTGSNLWFAAREGALVTGIDGSESAIDHARKRFAEDGLEADLRVGDFVRLPFDESQFDMIIDREALVCCDRSSARLAVAEIHRVLALGGLFFSNSYSKDNTSYRTATEGADGLCLDISEGSLIGAGQLCFYDRAEMLALYGEGWRILTLDHVRKVDELGTGGQVHAEWHLIAERI